MEERSRVGEAQERRLGLGEVRDVDDDRADIARELLLAAEDAHPGTAALRGPSEVVAEEQPDVPPPPPHLPGAHVGVVARRVLETREFKAEQAARGLERGLD